VSVVHNSPPHSRTLTDVAKEAVKGSVLAEGGDPTSYERFERLTREILAVPKSEIDKRRERARKRTRTRRTDS
jgi:hypothetical protein